MVNGEIFRNVNLVLSLDFEGEYPFLDKSGKKNHASPLGSPKFQRTEQSSYF